VNELVLLPVVAGTFNRGLKCAVQMRDDPHAFYLGASIKDVPVRGGKLPQWGHGGGRVKINKDILKTQNVFN